MEFNLVSVFYMWLNETCAAILRISMPQSCIGVLYHGVQQMKRKCFEKFFAARVPVRVEIFITPILFRPRKPTVARIVARFYAP